MRYIVLGVVCLAMSSGVALSQYSLSVTVLKEDVLVAEPVVVRLEIQNTAGNAQQCPMDFSGGGQNATYEWSADGVEWKVLEHNYVHDPRDATRELAPGESLRYDETLLIDWASGPDSLLFAEAGTYFIRVRSHRLSSSGIVTSNVVQVDVSSPVQQVDLDALQVLQTPGVLRALYWGHCENQICDSLEAVANGGSRYAPYAAVALASRTLGQTEFGLEIQTARAQAAGRAHDVLDWMAVADIEGFPLRGRALWFGVQAARILQDEPLETQLEQRIASEFSTSPEAYLIIEQ